jgi:hypothetical protein
LHPGFTAICNTGFLKDQHPFLRATFEAELQKSCAMVDFAEIAGRYMRSIARSSLPLSLPLKWIEIAGSYMPIQEASSLPESTRSQETQRQ